jgi:hypothetical protein
MLDTITAAPGPACAATRSLADRDEYGPLTGPRRWAVHRLRRPVGLVEQCDDGGRRIGAWVPEGFLLSGASRPTASPPRARWTAHRPTSGGLPWTPVPSTPPTASTRRQRRSRPPPPARGRFTDIRAVGSRDAANAHVRPSAHRVGDARSPRRARGPPARTVTRSIPAASRRARYL